jgi:AcrR family transcriptional regulator
VRNSAISKGPGRPPRSEERRLQILEAFERCVARSGLEATTLDDVAREAGLKRAMIRHYVGNRDELVRDAVEHLATEYLSRTAANLDAEGDAIGVDSLLDYFFVGDFAFGMREQAQVVDSLLWGAASDTEACASLRGMYEGFAELVRKQLARSVPGADPDRLASAAWAIICLADQNALMLGLGVPVQRSHELREVARGLIDSLR